MPLSLRFVVPLALALAAIAYAVVPLVDRLTFQWFVRDLDARGALIAQTAQEPLAELMGSPRGSRTRVLRYFERIMHGERIYALGFCDLREQLLYATSAFPKAGGCSGSQLGAAARRRSAARLGQPRFLRRHAARPAHDRARHELRAA